MVVIDPLKFAYTSSKSPQPMTKTTPYHAMAPFKDPLVQLDLGGNVVAYGMGYTKPNGLTVPKYYHFGVGSKNTLTPPVYFSSLHVHVPLSLQ